MHESVIQTEHLRETRHFKFFSELTVFRKESCCDRRKVTKTLQSIVNNSFSKENYKIQ
jgi:hypothetical protein